MKAKVNIENWFLYEYSDGLVICGEVLNHPKIQDNHHVLSSNVLAFSGDIVETRNTLYVCGKRLEALNDYWIGKGLDPNKVVYHEAIE